MRTAIIGSARIIGSSKGDSSGKGQQSVERMQFRFMPFVLRRGTCRPS